MVNQSSKSRTVLPVPRHLNCPIAGRVPEGRLAQNTCRASEGHLGRIEEKLCSTHYLYHETIPRFFIKACKLCIAVGRNGWAGIGEGKFTCQIKFVQQLVSQQLYVTSSCKQSIYFLSPLSFYLDKESACCLLAFLRSTQSIELMPATEVNMVHVQRLESASVYFTVTRLHIFNFLCRQSSSTPFSFSFPHLRLCDLHLHSCSTIFLLAIRVCGTCRCR